MDHNVQKLKRRSYRSRTVVINPREICPAEDASLAHQENTASGLDGPAGNLAASEMRPGKTTARPVLAYPCERDAAKEIIGKFHDFTLPAYGEPRQSQKHPDSPSMAGRAGAKNPSTQLQRSGFSNVKEFVQSVENKKVPDAFEHKGVAEASISFERSHSFKELVTAFHCIEKRISDDSISGILKKFKTNDERAENIEEDDVKIKLKMDVFPKIQNNPFLKGEFDVSMKPIENVSKRSSLRAMRRQKKGFIDKNAAPLDE